ncbi:MAG: DNA methyltransferase [Bacteroidota bacterium]
MAIGQPQHSSGGKNKKVENNKNYGDFLYDDSRRGSREKYPTSIFTEEIIVPNETVLTFQKPHPSKALHRTEKSIPFCEYIIKTYTNKDNTVLDNTMGSGVSAIACKNTERKYIGIDNDEKYYEIARERLNKM